ncbi:MAG: acireductone synthase [Vulcanococcus sp.]
MTITHLLLDIEGTTCPVSFVAEVLFPYASAQMGAYLAAQAHDPEVGQLLQAVDEAWAIDRDPEAQKLRHTWSATESNASTEGLAEYLQQLIRRDIKLTALKDLQGRIWRAGYASGEIVAPLFADVPAALERWHQQGYCLGVYSSGSVPAQQLLYGHCQSGDLRGLFSHWFDTRVGAKQEPNSYQAIAIEMQTAPSSVLFISDSLAELEAADQAGMQVLFSDREGNPGRESGRFERISDYGLLDPGHGFQ